MAEAFSERLRSYVLDGGDDDLKRLLSIAQLHADATRSALEKVGLSEGGAAIDCGCGPLGGLAVMAEIVGPSGRIVGVDLSHAAIRRARSFVSALGVSNIDLVEGDIHSHQTTTLGGPFDVALTRCFLMYQSDPVRTLRQIASLVKPGGWIVAQEPLPNPPPRAHPPSRALDDYWGLLHEVMAKAGATPGAVEGLPRAARAVGLEVVETDGFFLIADPKLLFELHAGTLAAAYERAEMLGFPAERFGDLIASLRAAKEGAFEWVTTPFFLNLAFRTPG
jgi:SAM-dependent methyltransferase